MELFIARDKNLKLDGGAMFGVIPKVMWNKVYPADENNLTNWATRCLLAIDGDRKILIDNGCGDKQDERFFKHYYMNGDFSIEADLKKLGIKNEEITDVILTHLHFDHCGGSVKYNANNQLELIYPNATHWISKKQWEWATNNPNRREGASYKKENILPIQEAGKLKLIENEDIEIYPGIRLVQFHGHTDGQIIPYVTSKGKTFCFTADLVPCSAHVGMAWIMGYDTRPLVTLEDKKRFYREVVDNNYILFFEHDIFNECCTLHETEKGVFVKEVFDLKDAFEK